MCGKETSPPKKTNFFKSYHGTSYQIAAHVFAIASGEDGVTLARRLGANVAVEGHSGRCSRLRSQVCPKMVFDAALITAGGEAADRVLTTMREVGRVAHPFWPQPEPNPGMSKE